MTLKLNREKIANTIKSRDWISVCCQIFIVAIFITFIVYPLAKLFADIGQENFGAYVSSDLFLQSLGNSILVSLAGTIVSVGLAFFLAVGLYRTRIKGKSIIATIFILPMLIPSISHGSGLIILFGNNGWVTKLFGLQSSNIYGFLGIVLGSVMYSFPIAFLMFSNLMKYEDYSQREAAKVLGIPQWRRVLDLSLPYYKKPLIAIFFSVFTMIFTDYGVPMVIGGHYITLPVLMYNEAINKLNFARGAIVALFLLIPSIIQFVLECSIKDRGTSQFVTKKYYIERNKSRDGFAIAFSILVSLLIIIILGSFLIITFTANYPMDPSFSLNNLKTIFVDKGYLIENSLIIAIAASILGTFLALVTSYLSTRTKTKLSGVLHFFSILTMAIPGMVLGLAFMLGFKGTAIYNTFIILIIVNMVHFFSSPYIMAKNTFDKINKNLEDVGKTLGISKFRILIHVLIPQMGGTIFEIFSYFFANSMITISAVSFLSTANTQPISLSISYYDQFGPVGCASAIALIILAINIIEKLIVYFIQKISNNRRNKYEAK